jgi:Cu/Ag efflux protein CusF
MEAMTMEYPVREKAEFAKLHVGDRITATVFVQDLDYWVGHIHREAGK